MIPPRNLGLIELRQRRSAIQGSHHFEKLPTVPCQYMQLPGSAVCGVFVSAITCWETVIRRRAVAQPKSSKPSTTTEHDCSNPYRFLSLQTSSYNFIASSLLTCSIPLLYSARRYILDAEEAFQAE